MALLDAARLEQEALQAEEHATTFESLCLLRLVVDRLQTVEVGLLERGHDAAVYGLLELLFGHISQLCDLTVHFVEVFSSQLSVAHHLLHPLLIDLASALLSKLSSQVLPSTLHGQTSITDINALLMKGLLHLKIELRADFVLHG